MLNYNLVCHGTQHSTNPSLPCPGNRGVQHHTLVLNRSNHGHQLVFPIICVGNTYREIEKGLSFQKLSSKSLSFYFLRENIQFWVYLEEIIYSECIDLGPRNQKSETTALLEVHSWPGSRRRAACSARDTLELLPMRTKGNVCQAVKHETSSARKYGEFPLDTCLHLNHGEFIFFVASCTFRVRWLGLCFMWSWSHLTLKAPAYIQHRKELVLVLNI